MKVKMTRNEAELQAIKLRRFTVGIKSAKVAYAVNRNLNVLDKEIKLTRKSLELEGEQKTKLEEYEKERLELCKKHAKKGENKEPVMKPGRSGAEEFVLADVEAFERDFEAIKEKHAEIVKDYEERVKQVREMMDEEVEFDLFELNASHIPWDTAPEKLEPMMNFLVGEPPAEPAKKE
jgi:seryl-tRNA synthetase